MLSDNDWEMRIEDIIESIEKIRRYTTGLTEATFTADDRTVDAAIRNLEIIGEAARYVPATVSQRHPQVPWSKMRGMRNVLIHGYREVSLSIVWRTIVDDLPPLVPMLRELLRRERGGDADGGV